MVVLVARLVLLLSVLLTVSLAQSQAGECERFRQESCQARGSQVLAVVRGVQSALECQTACFSRADCRMFSLFPGRSQCVLLRRCGRRTACTDCLTGPLQPRVSQCPRVARLTQQSCGPSCPCTACSDTDSQDDDGDLEDDLEDESQYDDSDYDPEEYDDSDDPVEGQDDVNIDDGLLDDVFEDEVAARNNNKKSNNNSGGGGNGGCSSCETTVVCVMGGSNSQGAVSEVASVEAGSQYARTPRSVYISPFSPAMTRAGGGGSSFSFYSGSGLTSCSPAYSLPTFSPRTGRLQYSLVAGSCWNYDFSRGQWTSQGGRMSFRQSGSLVSVGSYLMALGGQDQVGQPLNTVELFDPRRPSIGWREVPKWRTRRSVSEACSLVTRDPRLGPQVMVIGGRGQGRRVSRLVLSSSRWQAVAPMLQARLQHACTAVSLNGRPGVVVSGGNNGGNNNTDTVEFWDRNTNKWIDLPSLSRGRRSHSMTIIEGQLAVAGGLGTNRRGEDEFLDDVEIFDGRRWKRAGRGLDQPRSGANLVKIPVRRFSG